MTLTTVLLALLATLALATGINRLLNPERKPSPAAGSGEFVLGAVAGLVAFNVLLVTVGVILFATLGERENGRSLGGFLLPSLSVLLMTLAWAWQSKRRTPFTQGVSVGVAIMGIANIAVGAYVWFAR